ncbi:cystathionine beta-lyase [Terriglobus aquaticus]|uniref:Cystathionine beta-lyase n=1 Tax=Terriglobus aquaticus TaxID=940139 RepID=A0ABW9KFM5_9BACT|nr:cystathionine beta-lyase [Terriglobus aquaticus]
MAKDLEHKQDWRSKLSQPRAVEQGEFRSLAVPVHRGSTVVFPSQQDIREGWRDHAEGEYSYGIYGTPTALELAARIADLEGARQTFLVGSGQSAIALIYLAFCGTGSHVLVPSNAYGPNKELAAGLLQRCGIEAEVYEPSLGAGIAGLIRSSTSLVWCESPGSITMEVQDVPAIVAAAHAAGVPVALDNTYAAGVLFDAFAHGVDVSMQALTKYAGGHGDVLLGSVSVREESAYTRVGDTHRALGLTASPDDCSLVLRGLETLAIRMDAMERSALRIAEWLATQPAVGRVLHPALPTCEGHALWKRDFSGSASIFSVVFRDELPQEYVLRFVNALQRFKIGWSWGGTVSLVMAYPGLDRPRYGTGCIVRFHVGLEPIENLIEDLEQALAVCSRAS